MNKAEEQQFAILSSRVSSAEREKHEAQKKARLLEQKNSVLESEKADIQRRLNEKMDEVADTVKQMAQFMMGKGPVTLSDSLRDAIVSGVREEFEEKLRVQEEKHAKELQELKDFFALQLAAKDNEIAALRAQNGENHDDAPGTTNPGQPIPEGMTPEDRNKQLEQQNSSLWKKTSWQMRRDTSTRYYFVRGRSAGLPSIETIVSSQVALKQQRGWLDYYHILQTVRIIILTLSHIYAMFSVASRRLLRKTWSIYLSTSGSPCQYWRLHN